MIYNVYSVKDAKTCFASPFVDVSDDSAIRGFGFAFDSNAALIKYSPSDFSLYRVGMFDSVSGHLTEIVPEFICDASSFLKKVGVVNET